MAPGTGLRALPWVGNVQGFAWRQDVLSSWPTFSAAGGASSLTWGSAATWTKVMTARAPADFRAQIGDVVWVRPDPEQVRLFEAETGQGVS